MNYKSKTVSLIMSVSLLCTTTFANNPQNTLTDIQARAAAVQSGLEQKLQANGIQILDENQQPLNLANILKSNQSQEKRFFISVDEHFKIPKHELRIQSDGTAIMLGTREDGEEVIRSIQIDLQQTQVLDEESSVKLNAQIQTTYQSFLTELTEATGTQTSHSNSKQLRQPANGLGVGSGLITIMTVYFIPGFMLFTIGSISMVECVSIFPKSKKMERMARLHSQNMLSKNKSIAVCAIGTALAFTGLSLLDII